MKRKEKEQALVLRKSGYSLNEIASQLHVAKSTASLWLRITSLDTEALSRLNRRVEEARVRALSTRRQKRALFIQEEYNKKRKEVETIMYSPSLNRLLCALLYWCEGTKGEYRCRITNSDPTLIIAFLKLFRSSFIVDEKKFRACLHLHTYHDEIKQREYWSQITGIPLSQFTKTYQKSNTGKRKRENYPGCISIQYNDSKMATEIEATWKAFRDYMMGA